MERTVNCKRVVVVGMGASGESAARLALRKGAASVVLNDKRDAADLDDEKLMALAHAGVTFDLGAHRPETFAKADLIVVSPGVPPLRVIEAAEARGVPVVSELELASWYTRAPIVAITGTNGKSTVTTLIGEIFKAAGYATFVGGNLGTPLSEAVDTPAAESNGRLVVEVSSYQLEKTASFSPHVAVHLNLTADHLDRYPSLAAYGAAKARIFLYQRASDHAVVPGDDPVVVAFARGGVAKVHTFGGDKGETRVVDGVIVTRTGARYPLSLLKIRGAHNVSNAMASILAAELAGASRDATLEALESFEGLAHRMQFVLEDEGVVYYDDSKATNVGAAIRALEGTDRRVVLIAGGRDKGGSYDPLVQLLKTKARAVVLLGEAAPNLRAAIGTSVPHREADSMREAVRMARLLAEPGDCVLLAPACSSLDMFDNYAHRGRVFAAAVREFAVSPRTSDPGRGGDA
ncbi:MAG: UDP-N-acetylmuramoyl-L-alanine--D-glutamate ligase [Polyangiales bacterium]